MSWREDLTDRERKELEFAELYDKEFSHGTDGHNRLLLISKIASRLDHEEEKSNNFWNTVMELRRKLPRSD